MNRRSVLQSIPAVALLSVPAFTQPIGDVVYELRMCTAYPGKLNDLLARFRMHTMTLLESHGMKSIAYWSVIDAIGNQPSLVYILAHANRAAANVSWKAFETDPEWQKVKSESETEGPLVKNVQSLFMRPTDFSPLRP